MQKLIISLMLFVSFLGLSGSKSASDPSTWSNKKIDKWFKEKGWSSGWTITPDAINKQKRICSFLF